MRPGIVHRIDKDTTGALLICKDDMVHRNLAEQLKEHSIKDDIAQLSREISKKMKGL